MELKKKTILYWLATGIIILQSLVGAALDLSGSTYFTEVFDTLGYPEYLMTILGVWRIAGAITLAVPHFPRLKEWAYAGLFFDLSGAMVSHLFVEDQKGAIAPLVFLFMLMTSYFLRPPSKKNHK